MCFNAKAGCQKCCIEGKYSYVSGTTVFTKINQEARTNEKFRMNLYPNHQKHITPLIELPIDIIKDFVVADSLHLLELGIMKKLLNGWRSGKLGNNARWSVHEMKEVSGLLERIQMPREVNRDARSLHLFASWKGQEFRNFLNYYGVVVLRNHLRKKYYNNFLALFCAVRLCSSPKYLCKLPVAKLIFDSFILDFKKIYGSEYMSSNVHNVNHIVEDVARFGPLDSITAYPFENCLGLIKKIIRDGKEPLKQIANRLTERFYNESLNKSGSSEENISIKRIKYRCDLKIKGFTLSNGKFPDKWFFANNKIYCMVDAFEDGDGQFAIEGKELQFVEDFFLEIPFDSSHLNIYVGDITRLIAPSTIIPINEISLKFAAINYNNANPFVFIPLLHTLK